MLSLALLAASVGLADSLNPSTIGPALYLATGADATRRLTLFTVGAFAVYCAAGIALTAGPGQAVLAAIPRPHPKDTNVLELALGGLALVVAAILWLHRGVAAHRVGVEERRAARSSFLLGAVIMAVELPTALPYFAVVAAVVGSGEEKVHQLALILLFNLAFVSPLVAVTALRAVAGTRAEQSLKRIHDGLDRHAATLAVIVIVILAAALSVAGVVGLTS